MKRYGYIYENIIDIENIKLAIHKASKRKKKRISVMKILANEDYYAKQIHDMLVNKTYYPSDYIVQTIYDGARKKERTIYKPRFYPDQIIHWALMLQINNILEKRFYYYSCASRKGKGSDLCFRATKKATRRFKYCLKLDIKKYYPNVDKEILKKKFTRVFKDKELLWLLNTIINGNETQGTGIPIGNYSSQWFANFYLTDLDNYIKETLHAKFYIRYMDDMLVFSNNKRELSNIKRSIKLYLEQENLALKPNSRVINLNYEFIDFLGYRFYKDHITLRASNFLRIKRRIKRINKKGGLNLTDACAVISYNGLVKYADSNNYMRKYFYPYVSIKKCKRYVSKVAKNETNI